MGLSEIIARGVAMVGATAIRLREQRASGPQAFGARPAIPPAKPQGSIPTLKMPTARGWPAGRTPVAAPGLKVNAFATGLEASALDPRPAERRRADRRVADPPRRVPLRLRRRRSTPP